MKSNLPMSSGENGLIKSKKTMLVEAEQKIGQLENEKRGLHQMLEQLKWQTAQLRIGVTALAKHFEQTPEQVKAIYDKYCDEQNAELLKQNEEAKQKFIQDLKDGKVPEFKVIPGPGAGQAPVEQPDPNGSGAPVAQPPQEP